MKYVMVNELLWKDLLEKVITLVHMFKIRVG